MPKRLLLVCLLFYAGLMAAGANAASPPMLKELTAEAGALKTQQPERWRQYDKSAEELFAENQRVVAGWKKRSSPPAPDLATLKLPLAFLVDQPAIPPGIRFLLLSSLVKQHDEKSPDMIAHWIREEPEPWPRHLRAEAAEHWDEFGRNALATAERPDFRPSD